MNRTNRKPMIEVDGLPGRDCNWIVPSRKTPGAGNIIVTCHIKSARSCNYGRIEVEITPVMGDGRRWVNLDSVELI